MTQIVNGIITCAISSPFCPCFFCPRFIRRRLPVGRAFGWVYTFLGCAVVLPLSPVLFLAVVPTYKLAELLPSYILVRPKRWSTPRQTAQLTEFFFLRRRPRGCSLRPPSTFWSFWYPIVRKVVELRTLCA